MLVLVNLIKNTSQNCANWIDSGWNNFKEIFTDKNTTAIDKAKLMLKFITFPFRALIDADKLEEFIKKPSLLGGLDAINATSPISTLYDSLKTASGETLLHSFKDFFIKNCGSILNTLAPYFEKKLLSKSEAELKLDNDVLINEVLSEEEGRQVKSFKKNKEDNLKAIDEKIEQLSKLGTSIVANSAERLINQNQNQATIVRNG